MTARFQNSETAPCLLLLASECVTVTCGGLSNCSASRFKKTIAKVPMKDNTTASEAVAAASLEQILELPGIGAKTAEKILAAARGDQTADEPSE